MSCWQESSLGNHTDMPWMQEAQLEAQPESACGTSTCGSQASLKPPPFTSLPAMPRTQCRRRKLSTFGTQPCVLHWQQPPASTYQVTSEVPVPCSNTSLPAGCCTVPRQASQQPTRAHIKLPAASDGPLQAKHEAQLHALTEELGEREREVLSLKADLEATSKASSAQQPCAVQLCCCECVNLCSYSAALSPCWGCGIKEQGTCERHPLKTLTKVLSPLTLLRRRGL